jgi:UDP-N-acetylmuramoyl-L-alanyl-D-glutamate--2,6-diaminopimelate ligase
MTFDELMNLVSSKNGPGSQTRNNALGVPPCLRLDSRLVKDGDVFIAVEGTVCDGHDFIGQAIANGAKYIVAQQPYHCRDAEVITVVNSAKAAALLAQASSGNPASQLTNLAITGTNGKTTVTFLVRSCIQSAGEKCGLVGTIVYDTGTASFEAALTTPNCLTIAEKQSQMLKAGSKYMVIEASSHALYQERLASINFKAAAFTNLAGDHLDYHKTETDYLNAKAKLFRALPPDATAVLNKQSSHALELAGKTKARIFWYAVEKHTDLTAHIESMDITRTVFVLEYAGQRHTVDTPLLGRYNVTNHLAAAGLCLAAGFDLETIATGLSALRIVPGRLERIDWDGDFCVFIDYAHTDDALKSVLSTLKPLCAGKLSVVFGCGGDRDRTKRPRMARVAEQLADSVIVTSDNPRTERPEDIINEIVSGFENPDSQAITIEPDRKKAIELVIRTATKNDIVLIAGKGHETYQIIGEDKFDFSDKAIAEEYLKKQK